MEFDSENVMIDFLRDYYYVPGSFLILIGLFLGTYGLRKYQEAAFVFTFMTACTTTLMISGVKGWMASGTMVVISVLGGLICG
jgi:hypothetical protein